MLTMYRMDYLIFFFALCILGIHSKIFTDNPVYYYWIDKAIFRIAVPFFMCASGYLLGSKWLLHKGYDEQRSILVGYSKRLLKLLLVFEPISIVLRVVIMYLGGVYWYYCFTGYSFCSFLSLGRFMVCTGCIGRGVDCFLVFTKKKFAV